MLSFWGFVFIFRCLFDLNGNLKLADFGLSKYLNEDELAYSFCGSTEYFI